MTTETTPVAGVLRRTVLKAGAVAAGSIALMSPSTAGDDDPNATVAVGSHPDHGDVLVGPDGMTLYMFDADEQGAGESACDDDCAEAWPPLTVEDEPTAGEGVTADLTTVERDDGTTQVVAAGWPLYTFADDDAPGDATGQGVNDVWWVLEPDGTPVRDEPDGDDPAIDEPDGFEVEILAEHAPFTDDMAATFDLTFADEDGEAMDDADPIAVELDDASTVIFGEVNWEPDGTSGWHRHPGVVIVTMVEGEVEVTWEQDCVPRTYAAGESFFDPGEIHIADSDDGARAYAAFLGIPDGEPATEWVEPVEC